MKICLGNRQHEAYLSKCDEIKVEWRDHASVPNLLEKYPDKTIILRCFDEDITGDNWSKIKMYNGLSRGKLILCILDEANIPALQANNIKFYMAYPVNDFYTVNALRELGVEYIIPGPGIFFNRKALENCGVPIRAIPNLAYLDAIPKDGIYGTWIRPDDIAKYDYISAIEFEWVDIARESALFRMYSEEQYWAGPIAQIIRGVDSEAINSGIDEDLAEKRQNCNHACQTGGTCNACKLAFKLACPDFIKKIDK